MATNRDVKLTLSVETLGEEGIKTLKDEVTKLGKGAGDSAPEFEALAAEIDRIAGQAEAVQTLQKLRTSSIELGAAMQTAEESFTGAKQKLLDLKSATDVASAAQERAKTQVVETRDEIRQTENSIKSLKEQYTGAARETEAYTSQSEQLRGKKAALQRALDEEVNALKAANAAMAEAEATQKKQSAAVDRAAEAYAKSESAARKNAEAISEAEGVLRGQGVAAENLAQAQAQVVKALNATGQAALEAKARIDGVGVETQQAAKLARDAAQALDDAFGKLGVRSVEAITREMKSVRSAMELVKSESGQTGAALASAMSSGEARINELQRELRAVNNELTMGDKAASLFKNSMGQIAAGNLIADGIGYLVGKVKELAAEFVQVNIQAESMKRGLTAIYGSADVAGQQIRSLSGIAAAAGVSVSSISDSFVKFSASTKSANIPLSQSNELFAAVTRASATLGLGTEQTSRALEALGQMASKGCHGAGALIRMADGSDKKVEEVGIGDLLMGPDGEPRTVLMLATGDDELFEISPDGFEPFVVNSNHKCRLIDPHGATRTVILSDLVQNGLYKWANECGPVNFSIKPLGVGKFHGFLISGDHLYLDANGFEHHNTVSMEELRQQLGDALPGALSLSAKGMSLTDAELIKLVESGRLAARDFFPALTKGLQTLQGDTDGITQSWARFKTALTTTATSVGDAGFINILTAALKLLGGALGIVVTAMASFFEAIMLSVKGVNAFIGAISGDGFSTAINYMQEEMANAGDRINRITDSFIAMIAPSSDAAKRLQGTATATADVGAAATMTAGQLAELTKKYNEATQETLKYSGASDAVAKANAILADSSLDVGSKIAKLSVELGNLEDAKKKQVAVDEEGVKSAKAQAETVKTLADLRGEEHLILKANVEASALVLDASRKEAASREALAGTLAAELKAKTELAIQRDGSIEKSKVELQQLADKLAKADAEAQASREEAKNLETTTAALEIKRKAYADNSAAIDDLRKNLTHANEVLEASRRQFNAGALSADEYRKAQIEAATAAALLKDAEEDKAKAIALATKLKLADNTVAQSSLAMSMELAKEQVETAKRIGDEIGYRQALIRQKELEIKLDGLKVEAQKLEAQGSIAVAQAKMSELEVSDPLYKSKKAEYEATIKLAEAKLKLVDAQKQSIDYRQQELERIRSGAQALGGESSALGANTSARYDNVKSIDASTSARERAISAGEKELALKEREAALERKRKGVDENGFSADSSGRAISASVPTWFGIMSQLKGMGVPDDVARRLTSEFTNENGQVDYWNPKGIQKYQYDSRESIDINTAVSRAGEKWLRESGGQSGGSGAPYLQSNNQAQSQAQGKGYTFNINMNGSNTALHLASQSEADSLAQIIKQLTQAAKVSA